MSPERRALIVEALIAIHEEFSVDWNRRDIREWIEGFSDAQLSLKIVNIEALIERAQQTDV